jgi:hypothetical protein
MQQIRALIAGGSDVLLVETIFDSLNAKAALVAIRDVFDQDGKELPVMIDHRGLLECSRAREAVVRWTQLFTWSGFDVSVPFGTIRKIRCGDFVLSQCRFAEPLVTDRV